MQDSDRLSCVIPVGRNSSAIPVFTAPADTTKIASEEFFMRQSTYTEESKDFVTFIYQYPKDQSLAEGNYNSI